MIKAKSCDGYVDVEITGDSRDIAKELCLILDSLYQTEETHRIVIAAISNYRSHLQKSE